MKYYEKISRLLDIRGITIRDFVKGANISMQTAVNLTKSTSGAPNASTKKKIAAFFGASVPQLFDEEMEFSNVSENRILNEAAKKVLHDLISQRNNQRANERLAPVQGALNLLMDMPVGYKLSQDDIDMLDEAEQLLNKTADVVLSMERQIDELTRERDDWKRQAQAMIGISGSKVAGKKQRKSGQTSAPSSFKRHLGARADTTASRQLALKVANQ